MTFSEPDDFPVTAEHKVNVDQWSRRFACLTVRHATLGWTKPSLEVCFKTVRYCENKTGAAYVRTDD